MEKILCLELLTIFPLRLNVPRGLMHIPHYLWIRHLVISILRSFAKEEEINLFKKIASFVLNFYNAYVGKMVGIFTCLDYLA